ncbi:glycosyltransferase family 2 protein [Basilea psittacipulmonis]|uniref:glycosyltransferase family 2 protein n=1 Tax=Basilea psittacipulmonis TaxID=1472345 RepID=UPI00068F2C25|nr:glycosyltransferase family 2 protein [Basilea psittacipulmonis]
MKFAIIIAAYNVAPYLSQAIDSVISQDYKNFELIIVDDGSSDDTLSIAQQYALKHPDIIKVIDLGKNTGTWNARYQGVLATSEDVELITFLDGDDYFYPYALTNIHNQWSTTQPDFLCNSIFIEKEEQTEPQKNNIFKNQYKKEFTYRQKAFSLEQILGSYIIRQFFPWFIAGKVYKRSLLLSTYHRIGKITDRYYISEDLLLTIAYLISCQKIAMNFTPFYFYRYIPKKSEEYLRETRKQKNITISHLTKLSDNEEFIIKIFIQKHILLQKDYFFVFNRTPPYILRKIYKTKRRIKLKHIRSMYYRHVIGGIKGHTLALLSYFQKV